MKRPLFLAWIPVLIAINIAIGLAFLLSPRLMVTVGASGIELLIVWMFVSAAATSVISAFGAIICLRRLWDLGFEAVRKLVNWFKSCFLSRAAHLKNRLENLKKEMKMSFKSDYRKISKVSVYAWLWRHMNLIRATYAVIVITLATLAALLGKAWLIIAVIAIIAVSFVAVGFVVAEGNVGRGKRFPGH